MPSDEQAFPARDRAEYETAIAQFRHFASLPRQDMAFATTVRAVVLAIFKERLLNL